MFSQIKDRKHYSDVGVMPQRWDFGCGGQKLKHGDCDGAPWTGRSGFNYKNQDINEPSHDIEVLIKLSTKEGTVVCACSPEHLLFINAFTCNRRR